MKNIDSKGQIVIYQDSNDTPALSIRLENETLWLTQKQLAELFGVGISTINEHIKNIFEGQELDKNSTIRNFRIVQSEGKREVSRKYINKQFTKNSIPKDFLSLSRKWRQYESHSYTKLKK